MSFWKHLRAIGVLPFMVIVVIPLVLITLTGSINLGWGLSPELAIAVVIIGILIALLGIMLIYQTIRMFATIGEGTLAPWDPTQKLIVTGIYRYVRNPMISGVFCVLLGEGIVLGSSPIIIWAIIFIVINMIYMPLSEEPGLVRRFGEDYELYRKNVPRWIPRLRPWEQPSED